MMMLGDPGAIVERGGKDAGSVHMPARRRAAAARLDVPRESF